MIYEPFAYHLICTFRWQKVLFYWEFEAYRQHQQSGTHCHTPE
ncbi:MULTISPECIES: hypothetical protein [Chryseobacterium]|nr:MULTISPECIES: hypothetical protein [Chryseobacterium]